MDKVSVFINSTLTTDKNAIKYQALYFFYKSITDAKDKCELLTKETKNMNAYICAMLSFFKKNF